MMLQIIQFLITIVSILIIGGLLKGIRINSSRLLTAGLIALVIASLNFLVFPLMVILALPINFVTFGITLLIINGITIIIASWIVPDFEVDSLWWAILFSFLVSSITFLLELMLIPHSNMIMTT